MKPKPAPTGLYDHPGKWVAIDYATNTVIDWDPDDPIALGRRNPGSVIHRAPLPDDPEWIFSDWG